MLSTIIAKNPYDEPGKPGRPDIVDWDKDHVDLAWTPPEDVRELLSIRLTQQCVGRRRAIGSVRRRDARSVRLVAAGERSAGEVKSRNARM